MKIRYLSKMVCEIDIGNPSKEDLDNILEEVNYPPTPEAMGWASGVITPTNVGSSS